MDSAGRNTSVENPANGIDFRMEDLEISADRLVAQRLLGMAGAEPAQPVTERDVQIERHGFFCGQCG